MIRRATLLWALAATLAASPSPATCTESVCHGTTSRGRLENGCRLPYEGANFRAYSRIGSLLGRTYVHCTVGRVVQEAYAVLQESMPENVFVYGETGWAEGGRFRPHKSHQNGLSVDFMVPVRDGKGTSVPLPTNLLNRYGYDLRFDRQGRCGELTIDYEAMAAHILALRRAALRHGMRIRRVIFDPDLQPMLKQTEAWPSLEGEVTFSKRRSWVRHDEHYHVDFDIPCKPLR